MSNIFVPIDYSPIKDKIPPEEDILYSSLFKVNYELRLLKNKFTSHAIITNRNIYYWIPYIGKVKPPKLDVERLCNAYPIGNGFFEFPNFGKFVIKREPNLESKEEFKERKKKFPLTLIPIVLEDVRVQLDFLQANRKGPDYKRKWEKTAIKRIPQLESQLNKLLKK